MTDAIIIGSGKTKITAPVAGRSWSWQQDIWQVTKPVWLAWLHSIGVRSCAADWASGAPFVSGCLCARHIVPVQHVILLAWKAAPHAGAQSNIAASRHTQAPRFLPGATGTWSLCFMVESENYTSTCVCYPSAAETQVSRQSRRVLSPDELCGIHSVSVLVPPQPCLGRVRRAL
jgi:hypothetical protein